MKKIGSVLLVVIMALSLFACKTPTSSPDKGESLEGAISMKETFSLEGFDSISVINCYVNPLDITPDKNFQLITVEIEYSPVGTMKSKDVKLHTLDGTEYSNYSVDGLDYLGTAIQEGKKPFIRFKVPKDQSRFVLYLTQGQGKRVIVDKGEYLPPEESDGYEGHFKKMTYSKNIVLLKKSSMTEEEFAVAVSLQGIVAQKQSAIFIDVDNYTEYLERLKQEDSEVTVSEAASVWDAAALFKSSVKDQGFVTYDFARGDAGVNMAATVSAAMGYLGVPQSCKAAAENAGFTFKRDLAEVKGSNAERQRVIFNEYKDKLNKFALVHQLTTPTSYPMQLRDIGIALSCFTFFTDESAEDKAFRQEVLDWADSNIPVMGWTTDEIAFVADVSKSGDFVLPMDWASNQSFLMSIEYSGLAQKNSDHAISAVKGNHYAALVVSDGDNLQWVQRDFSTSSTYGQRLRSRTDYKLTWTFPPYLCELNALGAQHLYDKASQNDYFIAGVSGVGYMNCSTYPEQYLDDFTSLTAETMQKSDLDVVALLDNKNKISSDAEAEKRLGYYAKHAGIKGGIWQMDPDRYQSGQGKIYYAQNKPFISVRLSLWHPSNSAANVDDAFLKAQADIVNAYSTDTATQGAYSVINVHPWTINIKNLEKFVSYLAPNVKLVSAGELIDLVKTNIIK